MNDFTNIIYTCLVYYLHLLNNMFSRIGKNLKHCSLMTSCDYNLIDSIPTYKSNNLKKILILNVFVQLLCTLYIIFHIYMLYLYMLCTCNTINSFPTRNLNNFYIFIIVNNIVDSSQNILGVFILNSETIS